MAVLVLADHDNKALKASTLNAVTAATQLGGDVHILVVGSGAQSVADEAAKITGVAKVLFADDASLSHQLAEAVAPLIAGLAATYAHVLAPATTTGKNVLPRAAALLDVQMISDIIKIDSADTFVRPIYAGNALATVQSNDAIRLITVRLTAFAAAPATGGSAAIENIATAAVSTTSQFVSEEVTKSARPELTSARIVVSGGRGVGSKENFHIIEELADAFGAAMGASRAAVDAGYVPNDYQVGQTGKVVAPEFYLAVGISGAIQHLAGMKDSKIIAAINKDPEAPIFAVADYGLVGDLFTLAPELVAAVKK